MDSTTILGIIVALLILLTVFQTFQLFSIYNKLSANIVSAQIPTGAAITPAQTPAQLPAQRGGC